ncbi:ATP-binding protein [Paraburkholderia sediminicola]|uniref:ATP-binding protein n=1 Tax=Paraburkholderia sediminicola TaxID=458836 RepID=UPI0038B920A1
MSNINIQRAIDNIRSTTTVFTPIVEVVVNAIEAIEEARTNDGLIRLKVRRSSQQEMDLEEGDSKIIDVLVEDNGIGFTDENRMSFDTLYSDRKMQKGGKGFGRFTCLRYFDDVRIDSTYIGGELRRRQFEMGKKNELIVDERISDPVQAATGTTITLASERTGKLPRRLASLARGLVELLLPYFSTNGYVCPRIELSEMDGAGLIVLNDYIDSPGAIVHEVSLPVATFSLQGTVEARTFFVRVFKFLSPQNKVSKLSLVAHKREVTEASLAGYIPEFADEFVEDPGGDQSRRRNYILKAYVFGQYLDDNVLLERGSFSFQKDSDLILGISQAQIEVQAAELTKAAVLEQVVTRQERKRERLRQYVENQAPWYKPLMKSVDASTLSSAATETEMDALLHREQFKREVRIREDVVALLSSDDPNQIRQRARDLVDKVSETSKNELVHYVALRRQVLELFKRSLELTSDGSYLSEGAVHDVIFPTKTDSLDIGYESHNLWILDERLTFTTYLASDTPLNGGNTERPDIIAFDHPVAFRAENAASNPVTIFEFKRPGRDDFVNPSSKEDPVDQVVRYVNALRAGKYRTPKGREIDVGENTPFYGYVVCDLTTKVKKWLHDEKDFKPLPDGLGYFSWRGNINLYIEVLSWSKILNDAEIRNRAFFHKLGIQ